MSGKRRRRLLAGAIGAALGAIVLVFPPISASAATNITIRDFNCVGAFFCYAPASATSTVGTDVVWTNQGSPHTVSRCTSAACGTSGGTGTDTTFTTSGSIPNGGTYTHAFTAPGTYLYYCQIHGFSAMNGKVTVSGSDGTTTTTIPSTTTTIPTTTTTTTVPGGTAP
ncbi:MAG: cupredoxin domain-containing protein, partial [Acidimicrobiales bacterium]